MKLFVYTNTFTREGEKLMSASVGIRRGDIDYVGMVGLPFYVTEDRLFEAALGLISTAGSLETVLQNLGHEVEVEDVLKSYIPLADHLRAEYAK